MNSRFNWKRGTFSSTYEIFDGDLLIGKLKDSSFRQTSEGMIHNKGYRFRTSGIFKQETQIVDGESDRVLGTITYNSWKSRADIQLSGGLFQWKYDNIWQTRWRLYNEKGVQMSFAGGMSKGTVDFDSPDDLLLLTGLFVTNYYRQMGIAVLVAVLLPIWLASAN